MLLAFAIVAAILWVDGPLAVALIAIAAVIEVAEMAFWYRWSRRRKASVGAETLAGRRATVVLPCRPDGQVRLDGELWQARCAEGADPGERVRVESLEGLTLNVRKTDD